MKEFLKKLFNQQFLSQQEARAALLLIGRGEANAAEMAAFMTVFLMRSITVDELQGFREAMLEMCLSVDLADYDAMDIVGTGGDGKDTFNISTLSIFVAAGAGINIAKHGNYAVSSACGSSNVMEYLGVRFTNDVETLKRYMDQSGVCFLHAPMFHPAMKNVAPVRKEMGFKTFFNMLGPLINPAHLKKQMLGVYNLEMARKYAYLLQNSGNSFAIIHALDGYDEISLTGKFKVITQSYERIYSPSEIGLKTVKPEELYGGSTVEEAAKVFTNVLQNKATEAQKNTVIANAGLAIHCATGKELLDAIATARESLESGKAYERFSKLVQASK